MLCAFDLYGPIGDTVSVHFTDINHVCFEGCLEFVSKGTDISR